MKCRCIVRFCLLKAARLLTYAKKAVHKKWGGSRCFLPIFYERQKKDSGFKSVNSLGQTGNLTGRLLPVNDALACDLVQCRSRIGQSLLCGFLVIVLDGGANFLHHVLHTGTGGTIAGITLDALLMALDSGLVVSHGLLRFLLKGL